MFDINNDGTISKDELIKILRANHMAGSDKEVAKKAETIMTQADADNDGVVSWGAFLRLVNTFLRRKGVILMIFCCNANLLPHPPFPPRYR